MRFLVAGCGSIGRRHVANLLALRAGEVLVCDTAPEALAQVERQFQVRTFLRLDEALAQRPDAVVVCTPTYSHVPVALAALRAGAHLFVEKPVAATMEEARGLASEARKMGRTVLVGCNMRFHPGVAQLKQEMDSLRLQRPVLVRAHFSHYLPNWRPGQDYRQSYSARRAEGGGILLEGTHEIDYLRWFFGEVRSVEAFGGHFSPLEIDSEDVACLVMHYESGVVAEVSLDYLRPFKSRGCEVIAPEGVLRWVSEGKAPETVRVDYYDAGRGTWEDLYRCEAYDGNQMYLDELRHFLACVAGGDKPMADAEDGRRVLEIALLARESLERGWRRRSVPVPETVRRQA